MKSYDHILFPVALTHQSSMIGKRAAKIAEQANAKLTLLHVVETQKDYGKETEISSEKLIEEKRQQLSELAKPLSVSEADQHVLVGASKHVILDFAKKLNCDLILVASHAEHGYAHLLGSTAISVVHSAPCDVLTIRVGGPIIQDYHHALFPTALVEHSSMVAERAATFAKNVDAKLSLLHVVEPIIGYGFGSISPDAIERDFEHQAFWQLKELNKNIGISEKDLYVKSGTPKSVILETAHELATDIIIIASHGRHGVAHLLGSTATAVAHSAKCDVLTVRIKEKTIMTTQ